MLNPLSSLPFIPGRAGKWLRCGAIAILIAALVLLFARKITQLALPGLGVPARTTVIEPQCPTPEQKEVIQSNLKLYGVQLAIGAEDAIFLVGHLAVDHVDEDALDWVLGTVYAAVELCFRPAIRIGFASKFGDR